MNMMRCKLGLLGKEKEDKFLILDLLTLMHEKKADYTNTFCHLMNLGPKIDVLYKDKNFLNWENKWRERLKTYNNSPEKYNKLMRDFNPLVIPRNHKVEEVLYEANNNNLKPLESLLKILSDPYNENNNIIEYQIVPVTDKIYQTFCGT